MSKIKIKVQNQKGITWEGEGDSCSMVNDLGPFDILGEHTQFVTPIKDKITVRDNDKVVWEMTLPESALCRVKADSVEIWLGI